MFSRIIFILIAMLPFVGFSQGTSSHPDSAKLKEIIHLADFTRKNLNDKTVYAWFDSGYVAYKPTEMWVNYIGFFADEIKITVFGGSWCGDTKNLLPKFYRTIEDAGISPDRVRLIGVDRSKKAADGSEAGFGITNVPTFIIYLNGKEIGRIVESVPTSIEQEIAAILKKSAGQ